MRILWVANAGWSHQGYGVQVQGLLPHLVRQGHDIAVFAFWGLEGGRVRLPLDGADGVELLHYPRFVDPYGNDAVAGHARDWGADCVISLMDVWVCDPRVWAPLNWLAWLPIDQEPVPEPVLARLPHMLRALPYSRYGEKLIRQTGVPCTYIPHGVDMDVFQPFPELGRARAKEALGFEANDYLVGAVGANKGYPSRKGFPEMFQAFAEFRKQEPRARLYVHSQIESSWGGPNLHQLAELCGISAFVRFPNQYELAVGLPQQHMAMVYNAMDVLLQGSTHEGFGLPLIEAQACGTPVIATDTTSMTELKAPGYGHLVPQLQSQLTTLMSWASVPDIEGMAGALEAVAAYGMSKTDRALVRAFVKPYAWQTVAEHYWKPLLDQVGEQLGAAKSDRILMQALAGATEVEHRHDPSDPEAEPCCPECCDCSECCQEEDCTRHNCCCGCVVEELMAIAADPQVKLDAATDKYALCSHSSPSALDLHIDELRQQVAALDAEVGA